MRFIEPNPCAVYVHIPPESLSGAIVLRPVWMTRTTYSADASTSKLLEPSNCSAKLPEMLTPPEGKRTVHSEQNKQEKRCGNVKNHRLPFVSLSHVYGYMGWTA